MFCGECGTKNEKGARFCENCGAKLELEVPKKTKVKSTNNENLGTKWKKLSKTKKVIGGVILILLIALFAIYTIISNQLSPKTIAKNYFLAVVNKDVDAIYEYMDIETSDFANKEMFLKIFDDRYDDEDATKLSNYRVGKVNMSKDGLTATVTISYVEDGDNDTDTAEITLVKQKSKKYLLFDNWCISKSLYPVQVVSNFEFKALKNSKVKIEGIEVDSKYIDKKSSDETYDVYKMPAMFATEYDVVVTLPMGFDIENTLRVSESNNKINISAFDEDNLSDEMIKELEGLIKTGLQTLYNGAKDKQDFKSISETFGDKKIDLSDLEDTYNSLKNSLSNVNLTNINFTEVTLNDFSTYDDYYRVDVKTKYNYSLTYQSGNEVKTHDSSDSDSMYVYITYVDGAFHIVDAGSLNTYFSKYY